MLEEMVVDETRENAGHICFRKCTIEDLAELRALSSRTFFETFAAQNKPEDMEAYLRTAYAETRIRGEIETPGSEFHVAWLDGVPVGFLKLNIGAAQHEDMGPDMMEIERLYVRAGHKRHGIGGAMMRFALDRAHVAGCRGVWLGVWEHNESAKAFYARMGFTVVGSHVFSVGDDDQTDLLVARMD